MKRLHKQVADEILSTIAVAPEVPPVKVSPVVNDIASVIPI